MLTSFGGRPAVLALALASAIYSAPAAAQVVNPSDEVEDDRSGSLDFSANIAIASEYRFRGIDLSGGDPALQGGIDLAHGSGFYVGTWGSSLDDDTVGFGDLELDVYGGWSGQLSDALSIDIGAIGYLYPDAGPGDFDYYEFYGSLGFGLGPAEATLGLAYAPEQDSLGGTDNVYVYTDLGVGIPGTPVTIKGHVGYTDGFLTFTGDGMAFDWSLGAEASIYGPLTLSAAYVGAEDDIPRGAYDFADDAFVVTLGVTFCPNETGRGSRAPAFPLAEINRRWRGRGDRAGVRWSRAGWRNRSPPRPAIPEECRSWPRRCIRASRERPIRR